MNEGNDFFGMYLDKIGKKGGILQYAVHKKNGPVGAMVERLSATLCNNSKILELGTGTGVLGSLLAQKGFNVTAIDNDQRMIELAKNCASSLNVLIDFRFIDAFELLTHFEANYFDCAVSYGLMEHFSDAEIKQLLSIQKKLAKLVVFCVPGETIALKYQKRGNGTERYLPLKNWIKIIKETKITKIESFGFGYGLNSRYSIIPHDFSFNTTLSKLLAKFAGFYEIWL